MYLDPNFVDEFYTNPNKNLAKAKGRKKTDPKVFQKVAQSKDVKQSKIKGKNYLNRFSVIIIVV